MISIIIPCYNAEKTIQRCLESVLIQSAFFEILLADDGSTDATRRIAEAYTDRVRILSLTHSGVSKARSAGLAAAVGEWVLFLDADDALLPDALAKLEPYMSDDVDAICGTICRGNKMRRTSGKALAFPAGHELMDFVLADPTNYLTVHAWVFRRKEDMPRFDPELCIGEDSDWVLRYLNHSAKVMFVPVAVYRYTLSDDSTVHKWRKDQDRDYLKMIGKLGRSAVGKEKNWPLFVLTNYLLILTHVVFYPANPLGRKEQFQYAACFRNDLLIADAFKRANLSKLSWAKLAVLLCLRQNWMAPAYAAIRIRQYKNRKAKV